LSDDISNFVFCDGNDWNFALSPGTYWPDRSILAMLDPDIPDGIYHIKGRSREHGTQEWVEDRFFNTNYVIAEIKGTELTLKVFPVLDVNVKSLEIMLAQDRLSLSRRHITISTCGIVP